MDESALRSALTSLDTSWSSLEHWLWVCAFVVFVGVALEIVPVVWEYLIERNDFRRGTICSPERPLGIKFFLEVAGAVLVALGVFGELAVGIKMARVETDMRNDTAKLVSAIGQTAGKAKDSADQAADAARRAGAEARRAEQAAGRVKDLASDAEATAAKANLSAAKAEIRVTDVERRASTAEAKIAKVEPRELTPDQVKKMSAYLSKHRAWKFEIAPGMNVIDGQVLAKSISDVFDSKGWDAIPAITALILSFHGLGIIVGGSQDSIMWGQVIKEALHEGGIEAPLVADPNKASKPDSTIELRIGLK
jgi:hypothetical protein